jgi:HD-like signal output (HDOD) protein
MLVEDILDTLPPLNTTVSSLLTELGSENCSVDTVEMLLLQDPILSARTLHLANSSFYGFSRHIVSLKEAYVILGKNTLRNLVCTISLSDQFNQSNSSNEFLIKIWKHSLYSACLVSHLDEQKFEVENLFLVTLFQYIGLAALGIYKPTLIETLANRGVLNRKSMDQEAADIFNITISQLSKEILDYWRFPKLVCMQVGNLCTHNAVNTALNTCNIVSSALGNRPATWLIEDPISSLEFKEVFYNPKELKKIIKNTDEVFLSFLSLINS